MRTKVLFVLASLLIFAGLCAALGMVWWNERENRKDRILAASNLLLRETAFSTDAAIRDLCQKVLGLAKGPDVVAPVEAARDDALPAADRERVGDELLRVLESMSWLQQVSLLDDKGREIVRVDRTFSRDRASVLKPALAEQLQDRSESRYFRYGMRVPAGEVYVSPISPTLENWRIERPVRPTLHLACPVTDSKGIRRALVAMEARAEMFLRNLTGPEGCDLMLVDPEGYFLAHPDPRLCWGKEVAEYTGSPGLKFGDVYPGEWGPLNAAEGDRCAAAKAMILIQPLAVGKRELRFLCRIPHEVLGGGSVAMGALALALVFQVGLSTAGLVWISRREETHRKRAESEALAARLTQERNQALEEARKAAEDANQAKSRFLASVSHELRTPLTSIIGFSEILRDYPDAGGTDRSSMVRVIVESSHHLLALVNAVLDLAKIEAGKVAIKLAAVPLHSFCEVAVSTIQGTASKRGVIVACDAAGAPEWATLDERHVREVLFNLLGNAVKFTDKGGIVRLIVDQPDPHRLRFRVVDTGCGIPPDRIGGLFRPFEQIQEAQQGRPQGTGLGLAITRDLVLRMGGEVTAESELGKGSTFTVVLPYMEPPDREKQKPGERKVVPTEPLALTVVLFDDNDDIRELLSMHLRLWGCKVRAYADGSRLGEAFAEPADVVLCDTNMPDGGGARLAESIHAMPGYERMPVIACTASVLDHQRTQFLDTKQFVDLILKPIDWERLYEVLRKRVPRPSAIERNA